MKMSLRQEELGWLAGQATPNLDPTKIPSEMDIVRLYIYLFDKSLGENVAKKSPDKYDICKEIGTLLVEHRKALDDTAIIMLKHSINQRVKRIIDRVEKLKMSLHKNKKDMSETELETEKMNFEESVDVAKTDNVPPPSTKRKLADAFDFDQVLFKLVFT